MKNFKLLTVVIVLTTILTTGCGSKDTPTPGTQNDSGNENGLKNTILGKNNSNVVTSGDGLYQESTSNGTTYYFKGAVENNYIKFADTLFRIVRINEDGTIRIITQDNVISGQKFNTNRDKVEYMYYTNSELKTAVEDWFTTNITGDNANKVVSGNYFCEQAKVVYNKDYKSGNADTATKDNYTPSFDCATDKNGYGIVNGKVGLITIDEVLYAGGAIENSSNFYLKNGSDFWTMSPAGFTSYNAADAWDIRYDGYVICNFVHRTSNIRPVLNLNANNIITGSGTETDPYIVG